MKYTIGQKVRLKPLSECESTWIRIDPKMNQLFGKEHIISFFEYYDNNEAYQLYSTENDDFWWFQEDWIECAVDEKDPIDLEIERLQNLKKAELVQKEIDELQAQIDNKIKEFYELIGGEK